MSLHQLKNFMMFRTLSQPLRGQAGRFQTSKRRHYFLSTLQSRDCLYRIDTKFYIMKVERDNCLRLQWEVKTNDHWVSFLGYHFHFSYWLQNECSLSFMEDLLPCIFPTASFLPQSKQNIAIGGYYCVNRYKHMFLSLATASKAVLDVIKGKACF